MRRVTYKQHDLSESSYSDGELCRAIKNQIRINIGRKLFEDYCKLHDVLGLAGLRLERANQDRDRLRASLSNLVKANESWNAAVEKVVGRPPDWTDRYLDEARATLKETDHA